MKNKTKPKRTTYCNECYFGNYVETDCGYEWVCNHWKNREYDFSDSDGHWIHPDRTISSSKNDGNCKYYKNRDELVERAKRIKKLRRIK